MSNSTRLGLLSVACAIVWGSFWQLAPAQIDGAKVIQKWEYLAVGVGNDATENAKTMSQHGEKGWEFVAVVQNRSAYLAYFKRPK